MMLYIATSNPGKLRDFAIAAGEHNNIIIEPLPNLPEIAAPPEDGLTFAANARAKALYYSRFAPELLVLADDSGLEVDALHGEPGVRSARYAADAGFQPAGTPNAGPHPSAQNPDARNNLYLLSRLSNVPANQRRARYVCALVAARDGVSMYTGEGTVEGEILTTTRGTGGFGYDPLFYIPSLNKTMAEIDVATKYKISHRGNALRNLLKSLR